MKLAPSMFILLLASMLLQTTMAQDEHSVSLKATPPDCATALLGSGSYRRGSQATIEVRVSTECRFVEWRLRGGGLPERVSANPFTFYVFGDVEAEAVLQKLYRDNGTPVERVYVAFAANITSKAYAPPKPKVVITGEAVDIYAPQELFDGDYKYVFLYWSGPEGLRIDRASASVTVNESMTIVANYYTFKKFLDEYYPIHVFVKPSYPEVTLPDGRVERAVALMVKGYNITLPLQPVPEPLMKLVEPVYETYVPYTIVVESPYPVVVEVNGQPIGVGSTAKLMGKEGSAIMVKIPVTYGKLRLENYEVNGMAGARTGGDAEFIVAQLKTPLSILITYGEIPYAFLLDIPLVGGLAYGLTETGYGVISMLADPKTVPFPIAMALPLALIAAPGAGIAYAVKRVSRGGLGGALRAGLKIPTMSGMQKKLVELVEESRQTPIIEIVQDLPPESRIQAPAELGVRLSKVQALEQVKAVSEETPQEEIYEELPHDELVELENAAVEGGGKKFRSSLLQMAEVGEELFTGIQTGKVRLEKDSTPLVYSEEVARLARRASAMPSGLITVSGGERLLRERVVEAGLVKAGRRWARAPRDLMLPADADTIASMIKKLAKGANTLVVEGYASKALAQGALKARILVVSMLERGGDIDLPPLSDRLMPGLAAWLLLERDALKRLDYAAFKELVGLATSFRGLDTVSKYVELLDEGLSPEEALDQLWSTEFAAVFPAFESKIALRVLSEGLSYGEARDLYVTAYRQVTAGGDPQAGWKQFVAKLERLGVKVGGAG